MKRALVALATISLAVTAFPGPAAGDPDPLNTSYAAAAKVTPGAGLDPQVTTDGSVADLFDFLSPVLDQVVNPLTDQLTALPSTLVSDVVGGLTGTGFSATSPTSPQSRPSSWYPDCSSGGWTSDDCYGPAVASVSAAPLISVDGGSLQGYVAADSTGSYGKARTPGLSLSVLGIPLGNLGVARSSSQCLANQVCSSRAALSSMSLLGGTIAAKTASDGTLLVSLGGDSYAAVSALTSPVTLSPPDVLSASVQSLGGSLQVNIGMSLDDLLGVLGVADSLDSLNTTDAGSTITLTLTIGPGKTTSSDSTAAWGLDVGIGLGANIQLSVLGVATVGVDVPSDSTSGNLVDLQLGYTSAANSPALDSSGAPPDLT